MAAAFYFDLASPVAYLAAERILQLAGGPFEWQPVLARELPGLVSGAADRSPRALEGSRRGLEGSPGAHDGSAGALELEDRDETGTAALRAAIERRARALDLQALRWPADFPFDSALAMRAATYAKSIGRTVPFAQAAFRQAFAGGRSLAELDNVLIAAAACEMHPQAVLRGAELRSVREQLAATTAAAARAGVREVPAVRIGERLFAGEHALEDAARHTGMPVPATGAAAARTGGGRAR